MRVTLAVLSFLCAFLLYKVNNLEQRLAASEKNAAIAVLSAEIANDKIGAFAPYFAEDREKFVRRWIDGFNMPLAVVPDAVLAEIRGELDRKRGDAASQKLYQSMMSGKTKN